MNNCVYLKQKMNRTLYCKYKNKEIKISECSNCKYKEYKMQNNKSMCIKSNKLSKLERERKSIFTDNLDVCIICGKNKDNLHEVFFGKNRLNSIKYNIVIPVCFDCHKEIHLNKDWQDYWHKKGEKKFMEYYHKSIDEFRDIFKTNYL